MRKWEWEKLFEPIHIGAMCSKNRLVMSPMGTSLADTRGIVTPQQRAYYTERAKGGVGMITTEVTAILPNVNTNFNQLGVYSDDHIPGLTALTRAIREYDCLSVLQLHHAGRRVDPDKNNGVVPKAPSPIAIIGGVVPQEFTLPEIEAIIEAYADAALRAKKANFDAVELHGAHGYLISQFLSPLSNKRSDKYGGSLEKRTRFSVEIVRRIKDKLGNDYPVLFKISGDEYLPGGLTPQDTRIIANILQNAGINAITASAGHYGAAAPGIGMTVLDASFPRGCLVHLAQALKETVNIPVGAVGRINDPVLADSILKENKADLIYMGRALLADPELPSKAMRGSLEDIRTCIACCVCLKTRLQPGKADLNCSINAALGKEAEYRITPTAKPRKVLVAGGGPGGMEVARVAAMRGHKVFLYEKNEPGGQLLLAAIPPHKDEIRHLVRYFSTQMHKPGIKLVVGEEVTAQTIAQLKPDVVIIATGSVPIVPEIPGVEGDNVFLAEDVLTGGVKLKGTEVAIIGGGIVGCETGEFLASKGKKVTIVEMLPGIAGGLPDAVKANLEKRLREYGATILTRSKVKQITPGALVLENGGEIKADSLVLAVGRKPDRTLGESWRKEGMEVYVIGDCQNTGMIIDAIRGGAEAGRKID